MKNTGIKFILVCIVLVCSSLGLARPLSENSIFHINQKWQDVTGKEFLLTKLRDEIAIVAFVYTSCQYACPLIIEEMNRVIKNIKPSLQKQVKRVLISIDPVRDTPAALKAFAKKRKLDPEAWILLTAPHEDQVRELAVVMGASYKKMGDDFAHSNLIVVLNKEGEIAFKKQNIGSQIEEAVSVIEALAGKKK